MMYCLLICVVGCDHFKSLLKSGGGVLSEGGIGVSISIKCECSFKMQSILRSTCFQGWRKNNTLNVRTQF